LWLSALCLLPPHTQQHIFLANGRLLPSWWAKKWCVWGYKGRSCGGVSRLVNVMSGGPGTQLMTNVELSTAHGIYNSCSSHFHLSSGSFYWTTFNTGNTLRNPPCPRLQDVSSVPVVVKILLACRRVLGTWLDVDIKIKTTKYSCN